MRVTISNLDALMTQPVCNRHRRETHFDEQGHMGMPQVVDTDALHSRRFRAPVHLVMQIALRDREQPIVCLDAILYPNVILNFLCYLAN